MTVSPPASPSDGSPAPVGAAAASVAAPRSFIATWMFAWLLGGRTGSDRAQASGGVRGGAVRRVPVASNAAASERRAVSS